MKLNKDMFRQFRELKQGEFILLFVDTSGEGSDYNAGHFLSKQRLDIPIVLHYQGSIVDVTPEVKNVLEQIYRITGVKPVVCYETNNGGGYELDRLDRLNREDNYVIYRQYRLDSEGKLVKTDKKGWNTNSATRPQMLQTVLDFIDNELVTIYDEPTITEGFSFVKKKTPSGWRLEAEEGSHDDLIMALAGVLQMYQTEEPQIIDDSDEDYKTGDITSFWR